MVEQSHGGAPLCVITENLPFVFYNCQFSSLIKLANPAPTGFISNSNVSQKKSIEIRQ